MLTLTVPSAMIVKSIALSICALWLSISSGIEFADKRWSKYWKGIVFCVSTCLCFCLAMIFMRTFLQSTLRDQREDARRNISINYVIPPEYRNDPMKSRITVIDGSDQNLTGRHLLTCELVLATVNTGFFRGLVTWQRNTGVWVLKAGQPGADQIEKSFPISGRRTSGNHDAITGSCLAGWHFPSGVACADIKITFYYFLETQPNRLQSIAKRIVTFDDGAGSFDSYQESLERPGSHCCPSKGTWYPDLSEWCYGNAVGP